MWDILGVMILGTFEDQLLFKKFNFNKLSLCASYRFISLDQNRLRILFFLGYRSVHSIGLVYTLYIHHSLNCTGNVFVIAAILLDRHLQSVANYLILSLAVADLLVALLVMPLGAVYEVQCCTSSQC